MILTGDSRADSRQRTAQWREMAAVAADCKRQPRWQPWLQTVSDSRDGSRGCRL